MEVKKMIECLSDIGLGDEQKRMTKLLFESGQNSELIGYFKKCRCNLMDEMHESQRRVDRMDYLIRRAENMTIAQKGKGYQK